MSREITVLILSIAYLGLLFGIAWVGDRTARRWSVGRLGPIVYGLSLAIYCTSWTFYGSVGRAATVGPDFILIYIGPILVTVLGYAMQRKIVQLAKRNNITSIADFLAARYGKSRTVAVAATLFACVGVIPYIALQLQAVSSSFRAMGGDLSPQPGSADLIAENTALIVTAMMAVFTILFGVRNVQAAEQHRGMMLAIAFESVIKLFAFAAVGVFVVWGLFEGPGDLLARVASTPSIERALLGNGPTPAWLAITALAALAFLCLPRQFHVAVVEHDHPASLRTGRWMFPVYLVLINLFVVPIAAAGLLLAPGQNPDLFVLILPVSSDDYWLSILVFIGGLSAATSMVIVACMALSGMIGNELVMPYLLRRRADSGADLGPLLITVRRLSVIVILLAGYVYYRIIAGYLPLVSIGLVSFCAVANLAPGLLLGLYWRRAHRYGVLAGLGGGLVVWIWALLMPSLTQARDGIVTAPLAGLLPDFLAVLDPVSQGFVVGITLNTALMVGVSLLARISERDRLQAEAFVGGRDLPLPVPQPPAAAARIDELRRLLAQFVGSERAQQSFGDGQMSGSAAIATAERVLSGAVGAASARLMVAALERRRLSPLAARALLDDASEAIRHNYGILRNSLDHVGLGFAAFDRTGKLEVWNDRFASLLAIAPAELSVGLQPESLPGPHDLRTYLQRPEQARVHELRGPGGSFVEMRLDPLPDGGFVVTCIDVTSRVRTAEALRDSERRIRVYTDNVPVLIAYIDSEQRYRFTNRPYQAAFGLDAAQVDGRSIVDVVGSARYQRLRAHIDGVLAGVPQRFEIEFPTNDANIELAAGTYLPHVDEAGRVLGFFLLYQDITQTRRAEAELRQVNLTLERRVAERTAELTRVVAELERSRGDAVEANLGKTRFIAAASHDLLQPLHAAQLFSAALEERLPDNDLVPKIGGALAAVEALLDALLDISKLDTGTLKPEPRDFAVMPMLESLLAAFAPVAARRNAEIRLRPCSASLRTDPTLLRRILQNLVANALRYGGSETAAPRVLIACRRRGRDLRIEIRDNGPGIAEDKQSLIFQEFVRLHPATVDRGADRGLGLGLAIVDRIARMLGLRVELRSHPGRGSVFAISVPIADDVAPTADLTQSATLPAAIEPGAVVLCIDDDPRVREAMQTLISGWGCRVLVASDLIGGERQLAALGRMPDLVLVDLHLGDGPDGFQAIRRLRSLGGRDLAAALVTADRSAELRQRTRELGIELLHKPVKPAALRSLLRSRMRAVAALRA